MYHAHPQQLRRFFSCVDDLLPTPQVQAMRALPHHPGANCFEHSVFVSYTAFRLGERWGLDSRVCARAGLLHDLYLYRWTDHPRPLRHCFRHPVCALRNAGAVTELSEKEKNCILAHMFPLSPCLPRSREAWTVSLADKVCATAEILGLWRHTKLRALLAF